MTKSTIASIIIGVILFSMIVVGMTVPAANLASNYDVGYNSSYQDTYNQVNTISGYTNSTYKAFQESNVEETTFGVSKVQAAFGAVGLIFKMPTIIYGIMSNLAIDLQLPVWFIGGMFTIIILILTFTLVSVFIQRFI